jgi:hypothetical protein
MIDCGWAWGRAVFNIVSFEALLIAARPSRVMSALT